MSGVLLYVLGCLTIVALAYIINYLTFEEEDE